MTDITAALHGLKHEDDDERALARLPKSDDRISYHRKRLWAISQSSGAVGVADYKARYPEAKAIQVSSTTIAYQSKPPGYDDYLANLAVRWLTDDTALAARNSDDVAALNARFDTTRFNPANHFSKPLGRRTLAKIRESYSARGVPLDAAAVKSMSDIRKAAKAARARLRGRSEPFGKIGLISGNQLVCGGRVFPIMQHHGNDSIKLSVGGSRVWLRLDALAEFVALAGLLPGSAGDDSPNILYQRYMGDLVPDCEIPVFDPLMGGESGDLVPTSNSGDGLPLGELVPEAPRSLSDRIAALVDARPAQPSTGSANPDADPLARS